MALKEILEGKEYNSLKTSGKITVLHFYADWVEQCSYMNNILKEMSSNEKFKDVTFAMLAAENLPEISLKHNISAVPTIIFLADGKEIGRVDGADPNEVNTKLFQLMSTRKKLSNNSQLEDKIDFEKLSSGEISLEDRLKSLIKAADVMLFMKGTAAMPQCGFSRQIVQILNDHDVQFKTFDILNDSQVREGLKKFSNWPTYPQLYINGELIGGLDIVKELVESGEFKGMLPKSSKSDSLEDRLTELTSKSKVMIFIKGTRTQPRCGFTRQLVEILNKTGVQYETFNILEDEEVRQGLKKFSNWPTYPQVYVNGELIGGLDIIKEHLENGELSTLLNVQSGI